MVPGVVVRAEQLSQEIESFEPALCTGAGCALLAEALAQTEKAWGRGRGPGGGARRGLWGAPGPGLGRRG